VRACGVASCVLLRTCECKEASELPAVHEGGFDNFFRDAQTRDLAGSLCLTVIPQQH
jgi:hypothetical protein